MFRGSSRSRGAAPVAISQQDVPRESSLWRPSLRRIKKGLFSKSKIPENSDIAKPGGTYTASGQPLLELHQQRLKERNASRPQTAIPVAIQAGYLNSQYPSVLRKDRPISMGPRQQPQPQPQPKEPSTFGFVKRSLSRASSKRRSVQVPCEPIFTMRDVNKDEVEIISAGAPITSTASDFQKLNSNQSTRGDTSVARKSLLGQPQSPPNAAYLPKHAASDFQKLKLPFALDSNGLAQQPSDPSTKIHQVQMSDADLDDYQRFLKASRLAVAGNYNSYGVVSASNFTPTTAALVQERISLRQSMDKERERKYAMSQRSGSRPPSRAGSLYDRVADYVRPNREGSVRSQKTGWASLGGGDDNGSLNYNAVAGLREGDEKRVGRWSMVGGSIRRSFSKDRDTDGLFDGEGEEMGVLDGRGKKRRSKLMPVSPGLRRFNQAVVNGGH